jgi:hypothetical protein
MPEITSPYPRRTKGQNRSQFTVSVPQAFQEAMRQYQEWHTQEYGFTPSQGDIVQTSVLHENEKIRSLLKEIMKQGEHYGHSKRTSYLDGVKATRARK